MMKDEKILRRRRLIEFGILYARDKHSKVYPEWSEALDATSKAHRNNDPRYYEIGDKEEKLKAEMKVFRKLFEEGDRWLKEYDIEHELNGFSFDDLAPVVCKELGYTLVEQKKESWVKLRDHQGLEFDVPYYTVERWVIDYRHKINRKESVE